MPFIQTHIPNLLVFEPKIIEDSRGYFFESFNLQTFRAEGIEINPIDADARRLQESEMVRMFNQQGEVRLPVRITPLVRPGTVAMPKGVWRRHIANRWTSNALVPDSLTDVGGGACFNDARVQIEKVVM